MRKFERPLFLGGFAFLGAMTGTALLGQFTLMNAQDKKTERSTSNYAVQLSTDFKMSSLDSPSVVAIDA